MPEVNNPACAWSNAVMANPSPVLWRAAFAIWLAVSIATQAHAASPISDATDIIGLNLNMSPDQAEKLILAQNPSAKVSKLTANLATDYYKQDFLVGYYFEIEPPPETYEQRQGATDRRGEFIKIIFAPNANDLLGIVRYKGYGAQSFPTKDSVVSNVTQKYGTPLSTGMYRNNYFWMGAARVRSNMDGVNYDQRSGCSLLGVAGGEDFLFEKAGAFYNNGIPAFASGDQVSSDTSHAFIQILNTINQNNDAYRHCGVPFQVELGYPNNQDYVSSISQRTVDFDRANAELRKVNDAFWARANAAKAEKLKSDSGSQPKL